MVNLVTKFGYLKPSARRSRGGYAKYIATRDGVEKLDDTQCLAPATAKQKEFIDKLLHDFPDSKGMLEYADYVSQQTVGAASAFAHAHLLYESADKWGITFSEPYELPDQGSRPVAYASREKLMRAIRQAFPPPERETVLEQEPPAQSKLRLERAGKKEDCFPSIPRIHVTSMCVVACFPSTNIFRKGGRLSALFHPCLCRPSNGRHGDYCL